MYDTCSETEMDGCFTYLNDKPKIISAEVLGPHRVVMKLWGSGEDMAVIYVVDADGHRVVDNVQRIITIRVRRGVEEINQPDFEGMFFVTWLCKWSVYVRGEILLCLDPQKQQSMSLRGTPKPVVTAAVIQGGFSVQSAGVPLPAATSDDGTNGEEIIVTNEDRTTDGINTSLNAMAL
jgi:hypothetical protein